MNYLLTLHFASYQFTSLPYIPFSAKPHITILSDNSTDDCASGSLTDKSVLTVSTLAGGGAPVGCRNGSRTHTIQLMRLTDLPLVVSCYIRVDFYYRFATSSTELPRQLRASILINYEINYLSLFPRIPMRAISGIHCTIGIVVWFLHSTTATRAARVFVRFQRYPVRVNYWQLTLTFNRGL